LCCWRSAAARNAEVWSEVSDTWKVIPMVKATYAKSEYRGRACWLKSIPPAGSL
jgi:hypothetical protein